MEDIARDYFARRDMKLDDLLRTILVGYAVLAAALLDAATRLIPPSESGAEIRRICLYLFIFEVLDDFTGVAAAAFPEEQGTWEAGVDRGAQRCMRLAAHYSRSVIDVTS